LAEKNAADIIRQLKFLYKMLSEIELKEDVLSDF
jgi:molecular chaperone HscB